MTENELNGAAGSLEASGEALDEALEQTLGEAGEGLEELIEELPEEKIPKTSRIKLFFEGSRFGRWLYKHRWKFLIFFLPVAIMYLVYACFGVHPFGDMSVLVLDLNGQYVSYYEMMRDAIWGDGSLIYSWSRNLSGETMGMFGYYLASPFMWIVVLLPRTMICGAIEIMELAKIGCCGLAMAYYLKRSKGASVSSQVIFSVSYALMTYIVVELMNPMWIDGMIWLPIILLGIERLVDEGKMLPFILPLTVMFISHFYIGYMIGFFCALYFVYYIFSRPGRAIAPHWLSGGLKFAASAGISVLSAAIVLIPVYNSLSLGKLEFSTPDFIPKNQFDVVRFLSKLFANSYDTVRPEGLPMIACGTIMLILVPLFFLNTKIKPKEKISIGLLMLAVFGCMYVSTVDIAWHGFQVPNWLPYRYSFTFSFLMIVCGFRAFENLDGVSFKEICLTAFGWIVLLIYITQQDYYYMYLFETIWFSVLALSVFAGAVYFCKKYPKPVTAIVTCVIVCVEIFINSLWTVYSIDYDVVYSTYSSYAPYFKDGREIVSQLEERDGGLYRVEKTYHRTVNDPIGMGYAGISHSSSTMNTPVLKMLKALGYGMQGHYTKYTGQTLLTDSLFGIKYLMYKETRPDPEAENSEDDLKRIHYESEIKRPYKLYEKIMSPETTGVDEIEVYENPYALPIGYMADYDILKTSIASKNPFANQQAVLGGITGDASERVYHQIYPRFTDTTNCTTATTGDHMMYTTAVEGKDSYIEFVLDIDTDEPIYAFFPTIYQRQCNMWLKADSWDIQNYAFVDYFFTGDHYSILNLGSFEPGETIRLRMTLANKEAIFSDVLFYSIDTEKLGELYGEISKGGWNITEHSDTYLKGTVTAENDGILMTTIPSEPGWTIKVDGEEVEPVLLLDSLIGIELKAGEHEVTMKFFPDYLKLAIIVELIGLSFIALVAVFEVKDGALIKRILRKTA